MFQRKSSDLQQHQPQQQQVVSNDVDIVTPSRSADATNKYNNKSNPFYLYPSTKILILFIVVLHVARNLHESASKGDGAARSLLNNIRGKKPKTKAFTDEDGHWVPPPDWALTPLRQVDVEQYTIRMNTWRRPEQLKFSVNHYSSCPNVAQIQVIWCDKDNNPPLEVVNNPKVVIEYQVLNSLNERFRILESTDTPTLGILNVDDDAVLPCAAVDSGFYRWTKAPDRMVGFDGRAHKFTVNGIWAHQYDKDKTVGMTNKYSLSLTRMAFTHRDYLDLYTQQLPDDMLERIAKNFNCEDIAMSFMISSVTKGQAPLLADCWVLPRMIELHTPGISGGGDHQKMRHSCVNDFAEAFGIKDGPKKLQFAELRSSGARDFLECGAHLEGDASAHLRKSSGHMAYEAMKEAWEKTPQQQEEDVDKMYIPLEDKAEDANMIMLSMRESRKKYYGLDENP